MKKVLLGLVAGLIGMNLYAQQQQDNGCHVGDNLLEILKDPATLEKYLLFEQQVAAKLDNPIQHKKAGVRIIPVVFHVFHAGGSENITDAQLQSEIQELNRNFRKLSSNFNVTRDRFKPLAADLEIEFRLARKDPFGNCTNGIVRHYTPETQVGQNNLKLKSVWPTDQYFNVWVVSNIVNTSALQGIAGYAQFPWSGDFGTDGVMIRSDYTGTTGTSNPANGRTLTHEAGHWLNLYHTFQDGCEGLGDRVDDTPPATQRLAILPCDTTMNTCSIDDDIDTNIIYVDSIVYDTNLVPIDTVIIDTIIDIDTTANPDMIENYMDYIDGSCQTMFSTGQKVRVDNTLESWRKILVSQANNVATGTDVPNAPATCPPIADFFVYSNSICAGSSLKFYDNSYNFSGTVTRQWTFEGGSPATSSDVSPTISYAAAGKYKVTLIVSNGNGSDTTVKEQYIEVNTSPGSQSTPLLETFENASFPYNGWEKFTVGISDWERVYIPGGSIGGDYAYYINNAPGLANSQFNLVTPAMDLSTINSPKLSLYVAFARGLNPDGVTYTNDRFRVYRSTDCGQNWLVLLNVQGQALQTSGANPQGNFDFVPNSPEKWKLTTVDLNVIPAAQRSNVKLRFEFLSQAGNNFFMDNINIGYAASVGEIYNNDAYFNVYPNPTSGAADVMVNLQDAAQVKVKVYDMLGRLVSNVADGKLESGDHTFKLNNSGMGNGIYIVQLDVNGQSFTRKLVINK